MKRDTDYTWHLAELMARNKMHNSTDLAPHLAERGINLSSAQIWRLVKQRPERISLPVLAAICDVFHCSPAELITVTAEDAALAKVVNARPRQDPASDKVRPRRARVTPDD
ncbi:XRE family transcriptional regulator [Curtobacterium sp. MCLR17_039]|uniref:helix-turn-helix domain-containing protein n=1 Tax=unclassified Curtobacterium TaxID=257496 RepID=UPI000DA71EF4|nr:MULTISPECIES: helix-turn-helix transcriptional regulator [unclassified Curtobacterium]PZE86102.1 XRE family transcriptional regulator [Curtobacterium sp. MCLR17_039]WIB41123.1 helix-turn-helix transcriptional regulator [Curtobacterium sp. MCLR17_058]